MLIKNLKEDLKKVLTLMVEINKKYGTHRLSSYVIENQGSISIVNENGEIIAYIDISED